MSATKCEHCGLTLERPASKHVTPLQDLHGELAAHTPERCRDHLRAKLTAAESARAAAFRRGVEAAAKVCERLFRAKITSEHASAGLALDMAANEIRALRDEGEGKGG